MVYIFGVLLGISRLNALRIYNMKSLAFFLIIILLCPMVFAQTDATTPLHMLKPDYVTPYGIPKAEDVTKTLNLIHAYLDARTPTGFINEKTGEPVTDYSKIDKDTILARGDFRIVSYEWGVTYAAMLLASEATGDPRFRNYTDKRFSFIGDAAAGFKSSHADYSEWEAKMPLRNLVSPKALDDTGAMSAAIDRKSVV